MIELSNYNLFAISVGCISVFVAAKYFSYLKRQSVLSKWEKKSKNKVILHGLYGGRKLPTPSPFVLKLETYLRMAEIPYELDKSDIWGPKGKSPWISVNGQHVSDSQFIVEFLGKKFEKSFDVVYSEEQRAIGMSVRIMMEEYVYWGGILWRFAYGGRDTWEKVRSGQIKLGDWLIFHMIGPSLKSMAWTQGLGRHSEEEVLEIMRKCLRTLSTILGDKPFLLGAYPSEEDCAVFGQLASSVLMDNSPFEQLFEGKLKNLKKYCDRMKEKYWPDWNELLSA